MTRCINLASPIPAAEVRVAAQACDRLCVHVPVTAQPDYVHALVYESQFCQTLVVTLVVADEEQLARLQLYHAALLDQRRAMVAAPAGLLADTRLAGYLVLADDSLQIDALAYTVNDLREAVGLEVVAA